MRITLTWNELFYAALVGVMRQVQNLRARRLDRHGCQEDQGWQAHIEGACGEAAVARALGRWWSGALGDLAADDVGRFQIRTRSRDGYELIVHADDPDDRIFILVVGRAPTYRLVGWIRGGEAKRREWWKDPAGGRPAYFVPQAVLMPIDRLRSAGAVAGPVAAVEIRW